MTFVVRGVVTYGQEERHGPRHECPQHLRSNISYLLMLYEIYLNIADCTKVGQSILRKIIKIVGREMSHVNWLKHTKFDFGFQSPLGELTMFPSLTCKEREGWEKGKRGVDGRRGRGKGQFVTVCPLSNVDRDR